MRYNLFVDEIGYGWEVEDGVLCPLPFGHFPFVLKKGIGNTVESYKKIPKEYT